METKALVYRNWNELVFENRNKQYGAYLIRKSYNDKILIGLGISTATLIVLLVLPRIFSYFYPTIPSISKPLSDTVCDLTHPPVFDRKREQPKQAASQPATRRQDVPPMVIRDVVEPAPESPTADAVAEGSPTDLPGGSVNTGSESGIVEAPAVAAVETIFNSVEEMPAYNGGVQAMARFFHRNLKYPGTPRRLGIDGTVYVSFIVNGDGSIRNVQIVRGIHPDCDKEAMRVVSLLPGWGGGKQGGVPVSVRMVLPINFKLN
jgi:protein TonB